jgi:hypothetical protein
MERPLASKEPQLNGGDAGLSKERYFMLKIEEEKFRADLAKRGLELGESVTASRIINASGFDLWRMISTPGQLHKYHPYCRTNQVIKWPGIGSRDLVDYYSGIRFQRDFMYWRDGAGYDLQIGPPPRKSSWISWNIEALAPGKSLLSITVTPILESHILENVKKIFVRTYFGESISVYLDSLLRGADQFVTTGREVREKQFGPHPIYAP